MENKKMKILTTILTIFLCSCTNETVDENFEEVNTPGPTEGKVQAFENELCFYVFPKAYTYNGRELELEEVDKKLKAISNKEETVINIKVSKKAEHKTLVLLLDRMNKYKIHNLNLHTLPEDFSRKDALKKKP